MNCDMTDNRSGTLPSAVAWLGYGGLLPFVVPALAVLLDQAHAPLWRAVLLAYGAVILSFVGALHWGFAMSLPRLVDSHRLAAFVWSVVPALMAWIAILLPYGLGAPLLIAGFVANYLRDRHLSVQVDLPAWYLPLRLRLSSLACLSLCVGFLSA